MSALARLHSDTPPAQRLPVGPSLIADFKLTGFSSLPALAAHLVAKAEGRKIHLTAQVLTFTGYDTFRGYKVEACDRIADDRAWLGAVYLAGSLGDDLMAAIRRAGGR